MNYCLSKSCSVAFCIDGLHKVNRLKCVYDNKILDVPEIGKILCKRCKLVDVELELYKKHNHYSF
jgi:hypothetical protein